MPKVDFKRVETDAEVENIEIKDGQLIYSKSGKTFMDYGDERIPTGSGAGSGTPEVYIQEEEPTNEDWKIWIDTNEINNLGSEVVNSLDGNETNKSPSVNVVNNALNKYKFAVVDIVGVDLPYADITIENGKTGGFINSFRNISLTTTPSIYPVAGYIESSNTARIIFSNTLSSGSIQKISLIYETNE